MCSVYKGFFFSDQQVRMSTVTASKWEQLATFPFQFYSSPIFINDEEFIVCPSKHSNCEGDGIYIFNIRQKAWRKIMDYPDDFICYVTSAAFNSKTNTLFVTMADNKSLFKINLSTLKLTENINVPNSELIVIEDQDELHSIRDYQHRILDINQDTLSTSQTLNTGIEAKIANGHNWIYLKSQKCLLFFATRSDRFIGPRGIHRFSIKDRKWEELEDIILPYEFAHFGIVSTRDERYVILFDGKRWRGSEQNDIYIYDVIDNTFRQSKADCPVQSEYRATISDNINRDKLVVSGYINQCYKDSDFVHLQVLPFYLIELISKWYQYQNVYLMRHYAGRSLSEHFVINVDDILQP